MKLVINTLTLPKLTKVLHNGFDAIGFMSKKVPGELTHIAFPPSQTVIETRGKVDVKTRAISHRVHQVELEKLGTDIIIGHLIKQYIIPEELADSFSVIAEAPHYKLIELRYYIVTIEEDDPWRTGASMPLATSA